MKEISDQRGKLYAESLTPKQENAYLKACSDLKPIGVKQLADRVHELGAHRAAALGAPLLAGLRELALAELGSLEPLLRAHVRGTPD